MDRIPVYVTAGFKKSGKTSWINAMLECFNMPERTVLFTDNPADSFYFDQCIVHKVSEGCICCTAQTELVSAITASAQEETPARIMIELSGQGRLEDFRQIFQYLPDCRLQMMTFVLDMRKFKSLSAVMGELLPRQIAQASLIFANHCGKLAPESLESSFDILRGWNKNAILLPDTELPEFPPVPAFCKRNAKIQYSGFSEN